MTTLFGMGGGSLAGEVVVDASASGSIWAGSVAGTLINRGSLEAIASGPGTMQGVAGGMLRNEGTLRINGENSGPFGQSEALLRNEPGGVIVKDAGSGSSNVRWPIVNAGTIRSAAGNLRFWRGTGSPVLDGGTWLNDGGMVWLQAGDFDLGDGVDFRAHAGGATITAAEFESASHAVVVAGKIAPTVETSIDNLTVYNSGSIGGTAPLRVTDALSWTGGSVAAGATLWLDEDASGVIGGSTSATLNGRVINDGTLTLNGRVFASTGALLHNRGEFLANFQLYTALDVSAVGAAPKVLNEGSFRKTQGTGTTVIKWPYVDGGHTFAETGSLSFQGGTASFGRSQRSDHRGAANPASPDIERACAGKPVDCASGNQYEIQPDLLVGGTPGLTLTRTYNSQAAATAGAPGPFGYGWSATYSDALSIDAAAGLATVTHDNGSTATFAILETDYLAPPWVKATLERETDGSYTYTLPSQIVYRFASSGRLSAVIDRNGNQVTLSYDGDGRLETVSDPASRDLSYIYNGDGTVASVTDPSGLTVEYAYMSGELDSVSYAGQSGAQWSFDYDAAHQLTSMTDARGHTTATSYDASNRVVSQTDALNRTRTWDYTGGHTTITNPEGDVTRETFTDGQLTEITYAHGTAKARTATFTYDPVTRVRLTSVDPAGRTTSYGYDGAGNRTSVTIPGDRTTTLTYNATRDVTSVSAPTGKTTTFTYDAAGNLVSRERTLSRDGQPDVTQTYAYGYDTAGNLATVTDPLLHQSTFTYSARGDRLTATDPVGNTTSWTHDANSRVTSTTAPRGNMLGATPSEHTTVLQRDALGRVTAATDGQGRQSTTTYDALGNATSHTDPAGRTTTYAYDAENQLTATTQPGAATRALAYDDNGRLLSRTDENGKTTAYGRHVLGQVIAATDPLQRQTTFAHDSSGRLTSHTDPTGKTTSYSYLAGGELTGVDYQDPATPDLGYAYDADGTRTSMTDGAGTTTFDRDSLGRLVAVTDGHGDTVGYDYDLADRQTQITYPGGDEVTRGYDPAGRLASITDWQANTTAFDYDPDGNRTTITYPATTGNVERWAYTPAGQPTAITTIHDGTPLASLTYTYNPADQVTALVGTGALSASHTYDYDTRGRLNAEDSGTFAYDPASNLTALRGAAQSFDDGGQLTSSTSAGATTVHTYSLSGNRTQSTPASGPAVTFDYDQADQLTRVEDGVDPAITYSYDADGLRAAKTKNASTTRFTWDRSAGLPVLLAKDSTRYSR